MSTLRWEAPPPSGWEERLEPLLERPNEWAAVRDCDTSRAAHQAAYLLRKRTYGVPPGHWEFVARGFTVYARYLGPFPPS